MVRILLKDFPGLRHIADKLEPNSTSSLIDDCLIKEEEQGIAVWEAMYCASTLPSDPTKNTSTVADGQFTYYISIDRGKTFLVGDHGTNKVI